MGGGGVGGWGRGANDIRIRRKYVQRHFSQTSTKGVLSFSQYILATGGHFVIGIINTVLVAIPTRFFYSPCVFVFDYIYHRLRWLHS